MALDTFGGLKAAVAGWLAKTNLTSQIPDFVHLCEDVITRRVRRKTVRTTLTVTTEETTLPVDLAELRSIYPETGNAYNDQPLQIGTPSQVAEVRARHGGAAGFPRIATIVDGKLVVAPTPDQSYTFRVTYFQKLVRLAADGDTNAVLTEASDIYLYGTLLESAPYLQHDERIPTWQTRFDSAVAELNNVRVREETAASIKKARLPRVFG